MKRKPSKIGVLLEPVRVGDLSANPESIINELCRYLEIPYQRVVAEAPRVVRRPFNRLRLSRHDGQQGRRIELWICG